MQKYLQAPIAKSIRPTFKIHIIQSSDVYSKYIDRDFKTDLIINKQTNKGNFRIKYYNLFGQKYRLHIWITIV